MMAKTWAAAAGESSSSTAGRPLCITGATGTLGRAFARVCAARGVAHRLLSRQEMDIAVPASVASALEGLAPWGVVNTAGYVRVDAAEGEPERCFRENADGPAMLAAACAARGVALLTFSSDLVFDGAKGSPYVEGDRVAPLNVYGRSKAAAEARVLATLPTAVVVRTSAFFGPWDEYNFVTIALRTLAAGQPFPAASDLVISPTYVPDLVEACLDLLVAGQGGVWHVATPGAVTWAELARAAAGAAGLDAGAVRARPWREFGWAAPRPAYSALGSERGVALPPLEEALTRYLRARRPEWRPAAPATAPPEPPPAGEALGP
jgi:dTDP-4-dehydrorhamnose reductase